MLYIRKESQQFQSGDIVEYGGKLRGVVNAVFNGTVHWTADTGEACAMDIGNVKLLRVARPHVSKYGTRNWGKGLLQELIDKVEDRKALKNDPLDNFTRLPMKAGKYVVNMGAVVPSTPAPVLNERTAMEEFFFPKSESECIGCFAAPLDGCPVHGGE